MDEIFATLQEPEGVEPALAAALDRIEDFLAVQRASGGIDLEAAEALQLSVGLDEECRVLLRERLPEISSNASAGSVLFGLILGISIGEARREEATAPCG